MPEVILDSLGFALGVIWQQENEWIAKYFVQTHTVKVSTRADALCWINSHTAQPAHSIGVADLGSLLKLLDAEYARAFPGSPPTDFQDMVQRMAATVIELRRGA